MAKRLSVTFNNVIDSTGFIDVTNTITTNFIFGTPAAMGDVQIKDNVNDQALEFYTRFNADFNTLDDFDTHVKDNVVYINDIIDSAPIFDDAATDIPEVSLAVTDIQQYESIYNLNYKDLEGVLHEADIRKKDYYGFSTDVKGYCILNYTDFEDINNSIISSGLTIKLDADVSVTYEELYVENDRTFFVTYDRASQRLFNGWLTPDGFFEDYVTDRWEITVECVDGLAFLEDLSYVDDNGLFYTGKQSQLEIISNCLKRTGVQQNINTYIKVFYTGLSTSVDTLANVYYNADRFVKDDGDTIMSCKEVLNDVLEPYNARLLSFNGQWFVHRTDTDVEIGFGITYYRYDYLGAALTPTTDSLDYNFLLGSQIDGYYPHHANGNQSLSNRKSLGAYRISYKYGFDKSILDNTRLFWNMAAVDEWTINDALIARQPPGLDYGVNLELDDPVSLGMTSDIISLSADDVINYSGSFTTYGDAILFYSKVKLVNGGTTYYLLNNGEWTTTDNFIVYENSIRVPSAVFPEQDYVGTEASLNFTIDSDKLPVSGDLTIEFFASRVDNLSGDSIGYLTVSSVSIAAVRNDNNIIGEFHTVQREDNPTANVEEVKKVNVGDNPSDLYLGTIYKSDETTPTSTWFRTGVAEAKPILQIMGEETLRLNANTSRVFSGDCYGYVPYFSLITIENITGDFVPIKYSYDTINNITNITSKQVFGVELTDINYELTYDYGKTVKPTIKG